MEPTLSIGSGTGVLGPWKSWLRCFPLLLLNLIFCERYKGIASSACSSHWYQCHALTHTSLVWMYFPLKYTIEQPKKLEKLQSFQGYPKSMSFILKAYASSAINLDYLETILVHPTRRKTFPGKFHMVLCNIWDLVLSEKSGAVKERQKVKKIHHKKSVRMYYPIWILLSLSTEAVVSLVITHQQYVRCKRLFQNSGFLKQAPLITMNEDHQLCSWRQCAIKIRWCEVSRALRAFL